jgi:ABC-2 type transport system permease protein
MAAANPLAAAKPAIEQALTRDLVGPLSGLRNPADSIDVVLQRRYNPEGKSNLNVVPGLLAVILTQTMVMMTALAVTRERERGTMENLLAMPVRPLEVMIGKITPYIAIGAVQVTVILLVSWLLFGVGVQGSFTLFCLGTALFITANLALGFTISTVTQNQLQAMQASVFLLLPSILLSGFMFPFRGMPVWAQWIGEVLPATHFMRIVRGLMLKGAGFGSISAELLALVAILLVVSTLAISRYKVTLD